MQFERTVSTFGGSTGFTIPQDLLKYLQLEKGDKVILEDKIGQKGPYLVLFKKEGDPNEDSRAVKE